ncbi:BRO-N domain-containing protein [Fusobacterium russii]|uniref:BRO-N domain-containing protein n=1 Tax=Fusobacterium russii TaxID=854 RepID=UPI0003A53746|nr:Bro-N domain-containing protein [Fusobacterium russii]
MNDIKLFENKEIRSVWLEKKEEWFFSIVDIVGVLTESKDSGAYWRKLKQRLNAEGSEVVTLCHALKLKSHKDGKMYKTDVADMQGIFRIIQTIPSPKAEPLKMWLAQVGKERIDEIIDSELSIDRALETYLKKGYTPEWINQRLQAIQVRKELTDTWREQGIEKAQEYAILTNEITKAWSGMSTKEYKNFKKIVPEN